MTQYDEFHVFLTPDLQIKGQWNVELVDCPVPGLAGPQGSIQPAMTRAQLIKLRSRHGWPNSAALEAIGRNVWQSLMTPKLAANYAACLAHSPRLRMVVSMVGEELEPAMPDLIRFQELPLEVIFSAERNYLAPNPDTPISRSLKFKQDRDTPRIALPLRMLVVVATPEDKPPADMNKEKNVIQQALSKFSMAGGAVEVEFCDPPTRAELTTRLQQKSFHILHFITHGGFDIVGDDPSPRPHLCLEKDGLSDPLDAKTLDVVLLNNSILLVVMTACSSAAPTPDEEPYKASAFDGIAQRLISGGSSVNAVVAMQFDLESQAALIFSKAFYTRLLQRDLALDENVARCRQDLVGQLDEGHRAWVTPVVYWRCKDGQVFKLQDVKGSLDELTRQKLNEINVQLDVFLKNIKDVMGQPQTVRDAAEPLIQEWRKTIEELQQQRDQLLGETVRLRGGVVKVGGTLRCRLTLRLRTPARIGDVSLLVRHPGDKVRFVAASPGANTPGNLPLTGSPAVGEVKLVLQNVSQGAQWVPDEYELAILNFQVKTNVTDPLIELGVIDTQVQKDGADTTFDALNAVLFVTH